MGYLISIFVILMPWIFIPINGIQDQLRLPKAYFFDVMCLSIICFGIYKGLRFTYRNKYLSWLSIWVFLTMVFNWYCPVIMGKDGMPIFNVWALDGYIHYILALFASIICLSYLETHEYSTIARSICFSAVMVTIFAICQISGFDPLKHIVKYIEHDSDGAPINKNKFSALIDHPNLVGNYLVLSLPFFLMFKEHKYKFGALFIVLGIFLSKSSMSIIALCLITLFWLVMRFRTMRVCILSGICLVLLIILGLSHSGFNKLNTGFTGRYEVWQKAVEHIKDNPLFGQGSGITKMLGIKTGSMSWVFLHNDYLELIMQFGLLGLVLFLFVIGHSLRNFNYSRNNVIGLSYLCSFIVFLILMCGSFPFEAAPCALIGMLSWWGVEKIV